MVGSGRRQPGLPVLRLVRLLAWRQPGAVVQLEVVQPVMAVVAVTGTAAMLPLRAAQVSLIGAEQWRVGQPGPVVKRSQVWRQVGWAMVSSRLQRVWLRMRSQVA